MYKIKVKTSHKLFMENVFDGTKKSISFIADQEIFGRIDKHNGKYLLTTEDGFGSVCNPEYFDYE